MTSLLALAALAAPLVAAIPRGYPDCINGPLANNTVCNTSADPLARATALINAFTTAEKLGNMGSEAPGVPRLGLPAYTWWSEGLHGIAYSPGVNFNNAGNYSYATSFPQPILMGAAFDDPLIEAVATVVSTEARAFSNVGMAGLDFWTPNINPFKDPRWGRGQETPGEDPYHLSSYVAALIKGLQGDDTNNKRVIATCKHFAGYDMENWNGNMRYQWDAQISQQDLVEYYLPSFKSCAASNVGSFMCSYNALNGYPTCADPWLLQTVLREHWDFGSEQQYITSDCDAVQNVFMPHDFTSTREEAVAASLNAGTDMDCGTYYPHHLPAALQQGLITEATLDQALIRQYASLVRTGYFNGPNAAYRNLTFSDVSTPQAQSLARLVAAEGMVLLKNDGILPIKKNNMSIAMIGDWANATGNMQSSYTGRAPYLHSPVYAAEQLGYTVNYAQGPGGQGDPTTDSWNNIWPAVNASDMIMYIGGVANDTEAEGMDRVAIAYTGAQLDLIGELAMKGKPMIMVAMGGGQLDNSPIVSNPNISALLWGGVPGQDGGPAMFDVLTGAVPPAGRLPTTQYPSIYTQQVPMTNMSLRPGENNPGRTYKWYNGSAVFEFGTGLHYTNFSASFTKPLPAHNMSIASLVAGCTLPHKEDCAFHTFDVQVKNTGKKAAASGNTTTSDYVALGFLAGKFGPAPYPKKSLVAYQRLHSIAPGAHATASLNLTLGSLARVDGMGNTVLYPGNYALMIDTQPLTMVNFTLYGNATVLDLWPQPPADRHQNGTYFIGGFDGYTETLLNLS